VQAFDDVVGDLVLDALVQRRDRPVEDEVVGAFEQGAGEIELLPLHPRQALAAGADVKFKPDRQYVVIEIERIEQFTHDVAYTV